MGGLPHVLIKQFSFGMWRLPVVWEKFKLSKLAIIYPNVEDPSVLRVEAIDR